MILDFKKANEQKFFEWAAEWLTFPKDEPIEIIIAFLVANKVFTLEEIRSELNTKKIVLHENIFEDAVLINKKYDLVQRSKI